ncbi:hypothetical protein M9Y10_014764 [Tritrichomonas musculus]|uniref:DUF3447 domain-containing protein n=1 Tax=Tritrichomonas musculus TaxID=1915356 RepID=A0ABR2L3M9_9EUKA
MSKKEIKKYLEKMNAIQSCILQYLEDNEQIEENYENFKKIIEDQKILEDQHDFKSLLHLLIKIANNHYRCSNFFEKIESILKLLQNSIKKYFSNNEIFNIFKYNKRILLFLFEEKIIEINRSIVQQMQTFRFHHSKYNYYFYPEIKSYLKPEDKITFNEIGVNRDSSAQLKKEEKIPKDFNEKRKIGENHNEICRIIRNDLIDEFINYVTQKKMLLNSKLEPSIYETNIFLNFYKTLYIMNNISLIEYAAFFGSIQIFKYLQKNGCKLTDDLWANAIHGNNTEIIHILEEKKIKPKNNSYEDLLKIAIACHHNELANYINTKYMKNKGGKMRSIFNKCLSHYNFAFMEEKLFDKDSFYQLCKYDYYLIAKILLESPGIDVNQIIISFCHAFIQFHIFFFLIRMVTPMFQK